MGLYYIMKIAIPTYQRSDTIQKQTLKFLKEQGIHEKNIFLFVVEDEKEEYKKLGNYNVVVGEKGIKQQRQFMSRYFFENEFICYMDDDIMSLEYYDDREFKLIDFLKNAETLLKEENCGLLGVYAVDNKYFMKKGYTTDLKFIIGAFCVVRNTYICETRDYEMLEDYERTLKYYLYYKKVIRFNEVVVKHKINTNKGGIQAFFEKKDRLKKKYIEIDDFIEEYGDYCKLREKKNTKDILLNKTHTINLERYKYENNTLTTLWIGNIKETFKISLLSWIKLGYNLIIYTNASTIDKIKKTITDFQYNELNTIIFKIIGEKEEDINNILRFSDLFRYKTLYSQGGTWIDADMVLLKRLPNLCYILSSEYTNQTGAYKSKKKKIANIGLMRLPKNDYLLKEVIEKINNQKDKGDSASDIDNMVIFRKILDKERYYQYKKIVAEPHDYCPINWSFCKEMYYNDEQMALKSSKFGVPIYEDWRNSIGVHLWCNFTHNRHKIDFTKINSLSIFEALTKII